MFVTHSLIERRLNMQYAVKVTRELPSPFVQQVATIYTLFRGNYRRWLVIISRPASRKQ